MFVGELCKVRHMTQAGHESFLKVFKTLLKNEGVFALYKGGTATLLRQVTNQMIRFPIFVGSSNYLKRLQRIPNEQPLPAWQNLSVGAFAGMISTIINTPFDTIKTRMQRHGSTLGVQGVIKEIFADGGLRAYWAGVIPRTVRVAPGQAITWAVYAKVSNFIFIYFSKKVASWLGPDK